MMPIGVLTERLIRLVDMIVTVDETESVVPWARVYQLLYISSSILQLAAVDIYHVYFLPLVLLTLTQL